MPEGYTHVRTAQRPRMPSIISYVLPRSVCRRCQWADSFSAEVWKKGQNRTYNLPLLGSRMHEDKTGAFLLALLHHAHTQAQISIRWAFVPLCGGYRYAPLHCVVRQPQPAYGMKAATAPLKLRWIPPACQGYPAFRSPADDSSPVPVGQDLAEIAALLHQCILEVYGQDISVEALADSYYYTYRLRRLFTSRHGVRRAFYWVLELFFGGRGFITGHVSPAPQAEPAGGIGPLPPPPAKSATAGAALLKDAQHRCELFMTAALGHWMGKLDEEILEDPWQAGYITGTETEQSKSQQAPDAEQAGETA